MAGIVVGDDEVEEVKEYVDLRQEVNYAVEKEISRRIRAEWKAFSYIKDVG